MTTHKNLTIKYLKLNIFYGSVFFIFCSLSSLLLVNLGRLGLEIPVQLNITIIILILNIGLSPFLVDFNQYKTKNDLVFVKISFVILFSFFFILLGFILSNLYYLIAIVLIFISILNLKDIANSIDFKLLFILLALSSLFIVNYIPWKIEYLYSPEITFIGLGDNQTMQGAALTNIIKNYKMISLGGDGTENFLYKYHYGTYIWWASTSIVSNSKPLFVIPFTQLALFVPMIFFVTYVSAHTFLNKLFRSEFLFFTIFLFILFDTFSGKLHYDSETYTLSLIVLILLLPIIKYILNNNKIFFTIILIFLIPVICSLKLTTGFLYCILLGLVFFYNRKLKINYFFFFISVFLGILSAKLFMPTSYTDLSFWRLYSSYNQILSYQNLICIILPTFYMLNISFKFKYVEGNIFIIKRPSKNIIKKLSRWLFNSSASYPKLIIIAFFLSILPIFVLPVGSTGVYNIVQLHWLFLILFLATIMNNQLISKNYNKLIGVSLIILSIVIFFKPANLKLDILKIFFEKTLKTEIKGPSELRTIIFKNLKNEHKIFNKKQLYNIEDNSLKKILVQAKKYQNIHANNFAIYIPKNNSDFWKIIKRNKLPYWCSSTTFVIPALSGIQLIKGIQDPKLCETYYVAGPSEYEKNSYIDNLNFKEICIYARKKNIEYIYFLRSLYNFEKNNLIDCKV